jgi:magnesium transporter
MVIACAGYQGGRRVADLDVATCGSFPDESGRFVWIGLYEPSEDILRVVQRQFGLHDLAVEDAFRAHQRPKVDIYGDAIFMVLRTARLVDADIEFGETHVFAGKCYVISVRHGDTPSYKEVRARCESAPGMLKNGEDYVLYAIMDFVVDNYMRSSMRSSGRSRRLKTRCSGVLARSVLRPSDALLPCAETCCG